MGIYLDYNASAPIDSRVLETMISVYQNHFGNADSRTHGFGDDARQVVENARGQIAAILGIKQEEVFFTSGATESNNIALQGLKDYAQKTGKKHIITSSIEHKSVLETAKAMQAEGFDLDCVKPDSSGRISADQIKSLVRPDTLVVSVMHVNNETGIVQPVEEIGKFLSDRKVLFHVDATQSFGKLVDELRKTHYDMLSMSAHKIEGPQGVGLLVLRKKNYRLPPVHGILYGGQQEHGIRPGTIPVALVAGLGAACKYAFAEYKSNSAKAKSIKNRLLATIEKSEVHYICNGDQKYCIPTTLNVSFLGVSSEALMLATKQYCGISNGSACTSQNYSHSYVLSEMGLPPEQIESAVRISWGAKTNADITCMEFAKVLEVVKAMTE